MARPKVTGTNDPPRHIRTQEFNDEEKRAELVRQRRYTKEERGKRWIPIDPNVPLWARGLVNCIHDFREAHEIDRMIASYITIEAKENKKNEE